MKSYVIHTNGKKEEFLPANGATFTLEELYKAIGDGNPDPMVQAVPIPGQRLLICDDNGMMKNLPQNLTATMEHGLAPNRHVIIGPEGILGDVLICAADMLE